jgi:outer membrane PBP1 activator LpoA protein
MPDLPQAFYAQQAALRMEIDRLAIALPQHGPLAAPGHHLRDGILAAWYQLPASQRPSLRFLDVSEPTQVWSAYAEALEWGADAMIGPLQREAVTQLAASTELRLPILALNRSSDTSRAPRQLVQFGLAPEDEAEQAADRAWQQGYRFPAVLYPADRLGERLARAFAARWQLLSGTLPATQAFDPGANDFSSPIRQLFRLEESTARHARIERILGRNLEFEPTRRDDVDLIFLAADTIQARQLKPQLAFHFAADLPLYATSRTWNGTISALEAPDLKGIELTDLPWFLPGDEDPLNAEHLETVFADARSSLGRLYAMGIDAFQMLPELRRLHSWSEARYRGRTGILSIDPNGKVRRQLAWISLDREPQQLGYSPLLDAVLNPSLPVSATGMPAPPPETPDDAAQAPR